MDRTSISAAGAVLRSRTMSLLFVRTHQVFRTIGSTLVAPLSRSFYSSAVYNHGRPTTVQHHFKGMTTGGLTVASPLVRSGGTTNWLLSSSVYSQAIRLMSSTLKKRRAKMNKHKLKKRRKLERRKNK
jgi:Mitochondrial domain of unknown function (DUF1713)